MSSITLTYHVISCYYPHELTVCIYHRKSIVTRIIKQFSCPIKTVIRTKRGYLLSHHIFYYYKFVITHILILIFYSCSLLILPSNVRNFASIFLPWAALSLNTSVGPEPGGIPCQR